MRDEDVEEYLSTSLDETRLNIVEQQRYDGDLQLLLISHVEVKIDIENIAIALNERLKGQNRKEYSLRSKPMKHPFALAIGRLRERYSDDELRACYLEKIKENPDLSWEELIVQTAIAEV